MVVAVLAGLVTVSVALGLLFRLTRGRARRVAQKDEAAITGIDLGDEATLLQFSSTICSACAATRRILSAVRDDHPAVAHVEVDVVTRPDLVSRFNILQTPTTLILDRYGVPVARLGGAVRRDVVVAQLAGLLSHPPVSTQ
ncbi:MAG: thioredoxin [Glaciihabitans sp.]|nr:thioredoxin [Glaciihabitans sp.]